MPSKAFQKLSANSDDFDRLWQIHTTEAGSERGRKYGVEVLNKSAVVLVCAAWEAYCEDMVGEAIGHIACDCTDFSLLPKKLKTTVAESLKADAHDHAVWRLAGNGWKTELSSNANAAVSELTGQWNTPKSEPVKKLFAQALGIEDVTKNWTWQGAAGTVAKTTSRLDKFVTLRGEIAHRQKPKDSVRKKHGTDFYRHVCKLADKIDQTVHDVLKKVCKKTYW